ncbi:MAG TPA: tol-pal system protein YbgF [Pseudolabrys sp.]|nr:tol-pal system protein YbgF [Pseudolabrys sp.]
MTPSLLRALSAAVLAAPLLLGAAQAQDSRGGVFDNFFNRGQQNGESEQGGSSSASEVAVRLDRLENQLRQLTGTIEQLQYRNQQLEMQLKRMQDDTEYRLQQLGSKGGAPRAAAPMNAPMSAPAVPPSAPMPAQSAPGRRSDEFDPARNPNAPGVGRTLGQLGSGTPPIANDEPPIGAPGGRDAGAPLDLSTMTGNAQSAPVQTAIDNPGAGSQLPPPPARNTSATGTQLATLPPSSSPRDEYDLAYGYVLRKDYALAEQAFRDYLRKYPDEGRASDAQYWLGESLYQRQKYRDAGEAFLAVTTKYEHSGKAPEALLRLGQSLAAMHQKEAACATFGEVARKYPRASASVKRSVSQEQKRTHC